MGIYHVPLPVEYFSAFSLCLDCCVWVALSVGWKLVFPVLLWSLLPVGGVALVACQGVLVGGSCVCVLVGRVGSLLSGVQ